MKVRVTSRDSTRSVGDILEVKEETVMGYLTGQAMYPIMDVSDGESMFIITKYCEQEEQR